MRSPTIGNVRARWDSMPTSPSRSSLAPWWPRSVGGSRTTEPQQVRRLTDGFERRVTHHLKRRLAIDVGLAYLGAWVAGITFGYAIRRAGIWDEGTPFERSLLGWFHDQNLPEWLDKVVLQIPLTGTNLTILPAMVVIGWWL